MDGKLKFSLAFLCCLSVVLNICQAFMLYGNSGNRRSSNNEVLARSFVHTFEGIDVIATLNFTETKETLTVIINVTGKNAPPTKRMSIAFDMNGDGQLTGETDIFNSSALWELFSMPDLIIHTMSNNSTSKLAGIMYCEELRSWSVYLACVGMIKHPNIFCVQVSETTYIYHIVAISKPKTDIVFFETYDNPKRGFGTPLFHYIGG